MNAKLLKSGLDGRDGTPTPEGVGDQSPTLAVSGQGNLGDRIQRQSSLSLGDSVIGMGLAMQVGTQQGLQAFTTLQVDEDTAVDARETSVEGKAASRAGSAPADTGGEAEGDGAHLSDMEQAGQEGAPEEAVTVSFDLDGGGDLAVSSGGGIVLGGLDQVAARASALVEARSPSDEDDSLHLEAIITAPQPGSLLGDDGLVGDLLGEDGLVGSILDPIIGEDGLLDAILGDDGLVEDLLGAVLGEDGLIEDLLGQDGVVSDLLDPLLGEDGLLGGVLGDVAGGLGDILAPVFGDDGLLDVVIGEDGLLGGILGGDSILEELLGGSDGGGLLGGLLGGGSEGDGLLDQVVGTVVPAVTDTVGDTVEAVVDVVLGEDGLVGGLLGDDGLLGGLLGGGDSEDGGLTDEIVETVPDTVETVTDTVEGVVDTVVGEDGLVGGLLGDEGVVGGLTDEITEALPDTVEAVTDTVEGVVDTVVGEDGLVGGLLGDEGVVGGLTDEITEALPDTVETVTDTVEGVVDTVVGEDGLVGGLLGDEGVVGGLLGGLSLSGAASVVAEAAAADVLDVDSQTDVVSDLTVDSEGDDGFLDTLIGGADSEDAILDPSQGTVLAGLLGDEDVFGLDVPEPDVAADDLFAGLSGESGLTGALVDQGLLGLSENGDDPEPDAEIDGLLNDILAGGVEDMLGEGSTFDELFGDEGTVADAAENVGLLDGGAVDDALNILFDHGADQGSSLLGGLFSDDSSDDGR